MTIFDIGEMKYFVMVVIVDDGDVADQRVMIQINIDVIGDGENKRHEFWFWLLVTMMAKIDGMCVTPYMCNASKRHCVKTL